MPDSKTQNDGVEVKIEVESRGPSEFDVRVVQSGSRGASQSSHRVTLSRKDYLRLTGGQFAPDGRVGPEELVRRSFEFLLEREPKESILARFDLPVIGRYFPEYEREMKRRL